MIAETLAGLALVKSAVDGIKSAMATANDISDIAGQIDDLFLGEQQAQKARNKKAGASQFSVNSVAKETIDAKVAAEKLYEVSVLVDQRFGHGTWQGIVNERARRIQEAKQEARQQQIEQNRKNHEMMEIAKTVGISLLALIFVVTCITFSIIFASN